MTYTQVSSGDLIKASVANANWRHFGRAGLSSFYPMDTSGNYAYQDLGESGKPFGLLYGELSRTFQDGISGDFVSSGNFSLGGEYHYNDFTIQSGQTLSIDTTLKTLVLVVRGTLTIAGNIIGDYLGAAGGAAGVSGGNAGAGVVGYYGGGSGGAGNRDNGGTFGPGGAVLDITTRQSTAGGATTAAAGAAVVAYLEKLSRMSWPGYGAGGGGGVGSGTSLSAGGAGGAGIKIICNKLVITGTPTISSKGQQIAGTADAGSGGGGGGTIYLYYKTLTGSIPTLTVTGGAGQAGTAGRNGGAGGAGFSKSVQL